MLARRKNLRLGFFQQAAKPDRNHRTKKCLNEIFPEWDEIFRGMLSIAQSSIPRQS